MTKSITLENTTIEVSDERFKELVKEFVKPKGKWKPLVYSPYWTVCDNGTVDWINWRNDSEDIFRLANQNAFPTKEEAEQKLAYINALAEVNEYIEENDLALENVDWNSTIQQKWFVSYNYDEKRFFPDYEYNVNVLSVIPILDSEFSCSQLIANQSHNLKIIAGIK